MRSETIKLPIIDFSNLNQGMPMWESVKMRVLEALEEYGCFEAKYDILPQNLRELVFDGLRQLFDLPLQNKLRNTSSKPYHGYARRHPIGTILHESFGIEDAFVPGKIEKFLNLLSSDINPTISKSMLLFSEKLSNLQKLVRTIVLESLGLENYLDEHLKSTNDLIRLQKYEGPQCNETKLGLTPHTDMTVVTILYQNDVKGLQVLTKDGQWITADPSPNSFTVLAGDSFHAWTNGRLRSPHHRVIMNGNDPRYSIGLFTIPKGGVMIKAPDEMVDDDHPLLFHPFEHTEYLDFMQSEATWKFPTSLKAYCGV